MAKRQSAMQGAEFLRFAAGARGQFGPAFVGRQARAIPGDAAGGGKCAWTVLSGARLVSSVIVMRFGAAADKDGVEALKIAMIGGGYVGLVSGACFAAVGTEVAVVEADPMRLQALREGRIPIYEPGLTELVAEGVARGTLSFGADLQSAVQGADAVFIAVGTPTRRGDGHADLTYVYAAAEQVARSLTGYAVVVTKSTVPVGTGRRIASIFEHVAPGRDVDVASNPEFLREGSAIRDFMQPDRIVVGCATARARDVLGRLYAPLIATPDQLICTGVETAELIKYAANSFLAMKVTFINEMADLSEKLGANVKEVAHAIGLDARIGSRFLQPGPGFGGSCFPKDTLALVRIAQEAGAPSRLVEAVVAVNDARKAGMSARVINACGGSVRGRRIAVLGLTFKPDTDDMRDSPSIPIIARLAEDGAEVCVYDPQGMDQARPMLPLNVTYCGSANEALEAADALVLVTEWDEFRTLLPASIRARMAGDVVVDLRNIFEPAAMAAAGLRYHGIGTTPR